MVGCSTTTLGKHIRAGRLPVNRDKSLPMPDALKAWQAYRAAHPAQKPPPPRPAPEPAKDDDGEEAYASDRRVARSLEAVKLRKLHHQARLAELTADREAGKLVLADDVTRDAQAFAAIIRDGLLALPGRCALVLEAALADPSAARAPAIEAVLTDEVNALLATLHGSRFAGRAGGPGSGSAG